MLFLGLTVSLPPGSNGTVMSGVLCVLYIVNKAGGLVYNKVCCALLCVNFLLRLPAPQASGSAGPALPSAQVFGLIFRTLLFFSLPSACASGPVAWLATA